MRSSLLRSVGIGAALLWSLSGAQGAEIKWSKTFDAAMTEAKASNKLVMADFYTDW